MKRKIKKSQNFIQKYKKTLKKGLKEWIKDRIEEKTYHQWIASFLPWHFFFFIVILHSKWRAWLISRDLSLSDYSCTLYVEYTHSYLYPWVCRHSKIRSSGKNNFWLIIFLCECILWNKYKAATEHYIWIAGKFAGMLSN